MVDDLLLVSNVGLWVVVVVILALWLVLARQVGFLYHRMPPIGARDTGEGPEVGDRLTEQLTLLDGNVVALGEPRRRLLVLVSTTCSICHDLVPAIRTMSTRHDIETIVLITASTPAEATRFARDNGLPLQTVASVRAGTPFGVGSIPFGIGFSGEGLVVAKGVVNHLEHLESIVDGERRLVSATAGEMQEGT